MIKDGMLVLSEVPCQKKPISISTSKISNEIQNSFHPSYSIKL